MRQLAPKCVAQDDAARLRRHERPAWLARPHQPNPLQCALLASALLGPDPHRPTTLLHSFGGFAPVALQAGSNVWGTGFTPEGIDQNPVYYEFMLDANWRTKYCAPTVQSRRRCGLCPGADVDRVLAQMWAVSRRRCGPSPGTNVGPSQPAPPRSYWPIRSACAHSRRPNLRGKSGRLLHTHAHARRRRCIRTHAHARTHARTRTHTHAHTHT